MDEQQYIERRVDDQIQWHDRKSGWNQRWYKRVQVLTITAAALVPFASIFEFGPPWLSKGLPGLLGVVAAVAAGVAGVYRFQELWVDYRLTAESLRSEKFRFETRVAPYDEDDAFPRFVEAIESTLSRQNQRWQERYVSASQPPGAPPPDSPGPTPPGAPA